MPFACSHQHYDLVADGDTVFEVDASRIKYGRGALREVGSAAKEAGMNRVAFFTDVKVGALEFAETVRASLREAGCDVVEYDHVRIEPTDVSFKEAAHFAADGKFDGYVSLGGGSVIDTAKAANLFATYPDDFMAYVNAPIGAGKPVPGMLRPHIACPTTSGTGSESTGIAIFDLISMEAKTGIVSRRLRPTLGIIDPDVTRSLPGEVVACSGFDVLSHALESFTARPFTHRTKPQSGTGRPLSQGANPFSDIACVEALRILGGNIERAVRDANDDEAREQMMFASMLAGIGFGNAGCHAPHGMSYSVSGMVKDFLPPGYPPEAPIVPHGLSVIVNAPSVFRFTAPVCPERHLGAADALGADTRDAGPPDAGEVLAKRLVELMAACKIPNGLRGLGYGESDIDGLTSGAFPQQRLLSNSPRTIQKDDLRKLYEGALSYW